MQRWDEILRDYLLPYARAEAQAAAEAAELLTQQLRGEEEASDPGR